jgi:hypothetical protein
VANIQHHLSILRLVRQRLKQCRNFHNFRKIGFSQVRWFEV